MSLLRTTLLIMLVAVVDTQAFTYHRIKKPLKTNVDRIADFKRDTCRVNVDMTKYKAATEADLTCELKKPQKTGDQSGKTGTVMNIGQKLGEFASWTTGIALPFIQAGDAVLKGIGCFIPGIGLASFAFGLIKDKVDEEEKKAFYHEVTSAISAMDRTIDSKMNDIKHYVDSNTIAFEKGLMTGELQEKYRFVYDCLKYSFFFEVKPCLLDRCSLAKGAFYKFAVNHGKINTEKTLSLDEVKAAFKTLTALEIKRTYANIPVFLQYITDLLIPCELIEAALAEQQLRIADTEKTKSHPLNKIEALRAMKPLEGEVTEMILPYLTNALKIFKEAQVNAAEHLSSFERVKDYGMYVDKKDTNNYHVQCRLKISLLNGDTCDIEFDVDKTHFDQKTKDGDQTDVVYQYCALILDQWKKVPLPTLKSQYGISLGIAPWETKLNEYDRQVNEKWQKVVLIRDMTKKIEDLKKEIQKTKTGKTTKTHIAPNTAMNQSEALTDGSGSESIYSEAVL